MALGARVRHLRQAQGLTLEQLSARSDVDVGTISALELRDSQRSKYAAALARGLGVPLDALLDSPSTLSTPVAHFGGPADAAPAQLLPYPGLNNKSGSVQVTGVMRTGEGGEFHITDLPAREQGLRVYTTQPHPGAYALKVRGDGLAPTVEDGEFVLVDPSAPRDPGARVIIELTDGRRLMRKLLFERADTIAVRTINGPETNTLEKADVKSVHTVFAVYAAERWIAPLGD